MSGLALSLRVRPTILLFGDSITEFGFGVDGKIGWASLLAATYSRRADVLNRGFSGYNTQHALGVLPSILGNSNSDDNAKVPLLFCTVFFGANDCSLPHARQHLDIDSFDQNIRQIISNLRSGSVSVRHRTDDALPIILLTPPPVAAAAWDHYCTVVAPRPLSPRSNENAKAYGQRVVQIGEEMGCAVVNTYNLLGGDQGEEFYGKYMTDGLHLNEEGNRIVFEGIMQAIESDYKHLLPSANGSGHGIPLEEKLWSELC